MCAVVATTSIWMLSSLSILKDIILWISDGAMTQTLCVCAYSWQVWGNDFTAGAGVCVCAYHSTELLLLFWWDHHPSLAWEFYVGMNGEDQNKTQASSSWNFFPSFLGVQQVRACVARAWAKSAPGQHVLFIAVHGVAPIIPGCAYKTFSQGG